MITIPLAVFTAREGYAWQPGTKIPMSMLNECLARIGRLPDASSPSLPYGGAFLLGAEAVFYRFHVAAKADFRGRDALYLVLGCCPPAQARQLDFAQLLARPEFGRAQFPYPQEISCETGNAQPTGLSFAASFRQTLTGEATAAMRSAILQSRDMNAVII